jgi:hypothetical protein
MQQTHNRSLVAEYLASSHVGLIQVAAICFLSANPTFAQSARDPGRCEPVAGTISSNSIDEITTLGTVTGDLKGAISALTLAPPEPGDNQTFVFNIQPRWVTEAGDTIFFAKAQSTSALVEQGLFVSLSFPLRIVGGTGKFAGATGRLESLAVGDFRDPTGGRFVARYQGTVCFQKSTR